MKYEDKYLLILFSWLALFLIWACPEHSPPPCDYEAMIFGADHIWTIKADGQDLATDPAFAFPYHIVDYATLEVDLNAWLPDGTATAFTDAGRLTTVTVTATTVHFDSLVSAFAGGAGRIAVAFDEICQ